MSTVLGRPFCLHNEDISAPVGTRKANRRISVLTSYQTPLRPTAQEDTRAEIRAWNVEQRVENPTSEQDADGGNFRNATGVMMGFLGLANGDLTD